MTHCSHRRYALAGEILPAPLQNLRDSATIVLEHVKSGNYEQERIAQRHEFKTRCSVYFTLFCVDIKRKRSERRV